jgi:hypothetical protein
MFGFIPNLDVCMTASLTCPRHKYACVMSSLLRRTPDNQHDTKLIVMRGDVVDTSIEIEEA